MLLHLTKDLWLWCMERNILLPAQHLPGVLNSIADSESRIWSDRSEWRLSPALFHRINLQLGPFSTDLFAKQVVSSATSNSHRCLHSRLVQHSSEAICQFTKEHSRQSPISDTQSEGTGISPSGTSLESPIMVSTFTSDAGQRTTSYSSITRYNSVSMSEQPSRHCTPVSHARCNRDRC